MVFVACVVNQLRGMSSILLYRGFTNLIYLVSGDRQRTNFPVNASEAYNAHDSFAVSVLKEHDVVVGHHHHTPFSNHARTVLSFDSNVFFECSQPLQPRAHYSVFPYGSSFLTSYKFLGVAVC